MLDQEQRDEQGVRGQPLSGKLILPAAPGAKPGEWSADPQQQTTYIAPEMLIRRPRQSAPPTLLGKISYFWQKDPAYKVLILASVLVLIAGIIFSVIVGGTLIQSSSSMEARVPLTPPPGVAPTGTVDLRPTFPTPGGQGSNESSQPPMQSTPTLKPTRTTDNGANNGAVQITGLPGSVPNNSDLTVTVITNQPNSFVQLQVTYNVAPFVAVVNGNTDASGMATLTWHVQVFSVSKRAQARVHATVFGSDGAASSNTVTVRITTGAFAPAD
ncbi:hypothetical protein KTAU_32130 [Thermogemmatispora aurantia]|uniref:Uncharacterized protein n=1 Tax=Thermogemmatispora aurantia TaxID=2045279 RepID=A0A5J4KD29_9CHLR|nr:hypothetical protein [Thermogemmatispora aurantia]GER84577.1 hypothetical protein KTAU_32130 [Thermogemmatispora aurantia]